MKITNESSNELCPEGTHPARLVQLLDLGTQQPKNTKFKASRKVSLGWEIIDDDLMTGEDEDLHFMAFRRFPMKVSPTSHLGKLLQSWMGVTVKKGDAFDLEELLNEACLISIVHTEAEDGNTYANVDSVIRPPKGTKVGKAERDIVSLSLDANFDKKVFESLPDFVQEIIENSPEYKALNGKANKPKTPAPKKRGKK